jgi:hypothetical protein
MIHAKNNNEWIRLVAIGFKFLRNVFQGANYNLMLGNSFNGKACSMPLIASEVVFSHLLKQLLV